MFSMCHFQYVAIYDIKVCIFRSRSQSLITYTNDWNLVYNCCYSLKLFRQSDDTYQAAKVAKVLMVLNSGKGAELRGKSLNDV